MPTESLTPEAIRAMDGPTLARLAWEWGLAPSDVAWPAGYEYAYDEDGIAWRPYSRLAQADAVFRALRARGWDTANMYFDGDKQQSICRAVHWGNKQHPYLRDITTEYESGPGQDTEPLALLRCAVLAVASERDEAT